MSYSPDILDRFKFIVNQFEAKKKWLEDLQPILIERAEVDIAYSKNLVRVAALYEKFATKNNLEKGIAQIVMTARSAILTQSEQSMEYAQQLKGDVVDSLKAGIKKQQDELISLRQKSDFLKSELQRNLGELERQKPHYCRNYKMLSKNKEIVLSLSLSENNKLMAVLKDNEKLLIKNQKVIEDSLKNYNIFLDQYFTEIALSNKLQDAMEDYRIDKVKDAFMKTLVYQISAIKNVEYDTAQVSKKIENYKRQDPKPVFIETQERTMLSKLNTQNYLSYLHSEYQLPEIDRQIMKIDANNLESIEINKSLNRFNEMFGPRQQQLLRSASLTNGNNNGAHHGDLSNSQEDYFPNLLQNIFFSQQYLDNQTTKKFKDRIDLNEKERILFSIALDEFSINAKVSDSPNFNDKSMSDLIFLVSYVFERCESCRQCDLIERCLLSFLKICENYILDEKQRIVFIESLGQHHVLISKDLWIQETIKKINQAIARDISKLQISKSVFAEQQIKQDISKWRNLKLSQPLQIEIMKGIASIFKIDGEKVKFFENVILEKEKIQKKPIFSSGVQSEQVSKLNVPQASINEILNSAHQESTYSTEDTKNSELLTNENILSNGENGQKLNFKQLGNHAHESNGDKKASVVDNGSNSANHQVVQ